MEGMGLPLRESLPLLGDTLIEQGLRERIKVICAGKCITAYEVAWALAMGADFANSARGFMFALGCIQAMRCNRNTCPTGITTHDPRLQRGLVVTDKAERLANYARNGDGRWAVAFAGRPAPVFAGAGRVTASFSSCRAGDNPPSACRAAGSASLLPPYTLYP